MASLTTMLEDTIKMKSDLYTNDLKRYTVRAIYAGVMLGLGALAATLVSGQFAFIHPDLARIVYGAMFGWGLSMITFMNGELATSNMMYMGAAIQYQTIPTRQALTLIIYCTLMNFIGTVGVSILATKTLAFANPDIAAFVFGVVEVKLQKSNGLILLDGALANVLVNIAVIGALRMKDSIGKLVFSLGVIGIFAFFGFEHVIANFVVFTYGIFVKPGIVGMEFVNVVRQLLMSFLGNLIGGTFLVGMIYAWLNQTNTSYKD